MKVTLIQTSLHWEDPEKNLSHFDGLVKSISEPTDLIVLPEMFSTGFTMKPETLAEESPGRSLKWLKEVSKQKEAVITGSVSVKENGKYYNRLYWVSADGQFQHYDKRHLFRMAKEDQHYTAGSKRIIVPLQDWKFCPLVCYDLRFPVWSRNRYTQKGASGQLAVSSKQEQEVSWDYDVLVYVANWPAARSYAWRQLLISRAIENQCYVIAVNRIGKDGNGFDHCGDSMIINPRGEIISDLKNNEEMSRTYTLDWPYLAEFRKTFPVGLDADAFELK